MLSYGFSLCQADKLPHPEDVFKFLSARRIGRKCAIFYNAWALVAESANNMNLADKIYDAGLKRYGNTL